MMTITMKQPERGEPLEIHLSGKLTREDYEAFVPSVERLTEEHGKIDLLVAMHDFHGWNAGALWEDTRFAVDHFDDVGRLAVIGESKWQQGMATFCKPFTTAKIRYFDASRADAAREWLAT